MIGIASESLPGPGHPARIVQYIEAAHTFYAPAYDEPLTLNDATANLCSWRQNGSTVAAGMKGLVKQTQSVLPGLSSGKGVYLL